MTTPALLESTVPGGPTPKPLTEGKQPLGILIGLWAFVVVPFIALFVAVPIAWGGWLHWSDVAIALVLYYVAGFGVTAGFHRYLTHGSYKAKRWLRVTLAVAGAMAVQGTPTQWVADHRRHHAYSDLEGDPHSPWAYGKGFWGLTKGLFHAHMGWLFTDHGQAERRKYAKELIEDRGMRRINRRFHWWVLLGLAMAGLIGFVLGGFTLKALLTGLLWGGLVRIFLQHHVTWSINSVCHFFGRRRFDIEDHSTNVFWLALPTLGEAWHHNHHAFPRSAAHGLGRRELDPSAWVIRAMERVGLVWNVVRIAPERQAQKLIVPAAATAPAEDRVPTPVG